jgi:hypothetical protein
MNSSHKLFVGEFLERLPKVRLSQGFVNVESLFENFPEISHNSLKISFQAVLGELPVWKYYPSITIFGRDRM